MCDCGVPTSQLIFVNWIWSRVENEGVVILTQDPDTGVLKQEIAGTVTEEDGTDGDAVQEQTLTEVVPEQVELTEEQLISSDVV